METTNNEDNEDNKGEDGFMAGSVNDQPNQSAPQENAKGTVGVFCCGFWIALFVVVIVY